MSDMWALTFDKVRDGWETSTGLVKERVPVPTLDEASDPTDGSKVLVRVRYAGFCGSDRGIWWRKAFGDMILNSLDDEGKTRRVVGHELLGEIIEVGSRVAEKYGYKPGDIVTTESHLVCGTCYQCRIGDSHVCLNDRIIGISIDGCFAEVIKLPAKALWRTDLSRIRPEVAAVQEPFGNAVHACSVTDLRGKSVAIFGTGTIGLFAVLIARGMGARRVIGIEPDPTHRKLALELGADAVIEPPPVDPERPWAASPAIREEILALTDGIGVDVAMEMSGFNSSLNNAVSVARRGGHVVLFGVKNGDVVVQDMHRVVMNGLQLHGVVGRRIFSTWDMTRSLLENTDNGIQDAIWRVILNQGDGPLVHINDWEKASFEERIKRWPKPVIQFV